MYKSSLALFALTVGLFSASQAKASTLDTFVLTGDGNTFSFSLTSPSTASTGSSCPIHSFGDFCYNGISVTDNGHIQSDTVEFSSDGDLDIFNNHGQSILELSLNSHQALFFTDSHGVVTFLDGTFKFTGDDNGYGADDYSRYYDCGHDSAYSLVLDPPTPPATTPVPEPSSLALMSTGLFAAAGAVRRRMKK